MDTPEVKAFNAELSSMYENKPPISKAKMSAITRGAIKAIKNYKHVVHSVEKFIQKCKPEYKVPGLYVIDSIVRQSRHQFGHDKDLFAPRFAKNMQHTFANLFRCPPEDKRNIIRVLNLWQKNSVFGPEVTQPLMDMADPNHPLHAEYKDKDVQSTSLNVSHNTADNKSSPAPALHTPQNTTPMGDQFQDQPSSQQGMKFNRKLLNDFEYDSEDDQPQPMETERQDRQQSAHNQSHNQPTTYTQPAVDALGSILTNPEIMRQLQSLQQQMQMMTGMQIPNLMPMISEIPQPAQNQFQPDHQKDRHDEGGNNESDIEFVETGPQVIEITDANDSRSPSPKRRHRSRSRSPKRRRRSRSRSRSPRRRRERDREREREKTNKEKEAEKEKQKEREKRGLPPIKKEHLSVCTTTLWVGHLSKLATPEELSDMFGAIGGIASIDVVAPRGCAFVVMERRRDAHRAINKLNKHKLHSKEITVAWAPGKGVKGREWKDYWEAELGVSYLPWSALHTRWSMGALSLDALEDGGSVDEETLPSWLPPRMIPKIDNIPMPMMPGMPGTPGMMPAIPPNLPLGNIPNMPSMPAGLMPRMPPPGMTAGIPPGMTPGMPPGMRPPSIPTAVPGLQGDPGLPPTGALLGFPPGLPPQSLPQPGMVAGFLGGLLGVGGLGGLGGMPLPLPNLPNHQSLIGTHRHTHVARSTEISQADDAMELDNEDTHSSDQPTHTTDSNNTMQLPLLSDQLQALMSKPPPTFNASEPPPGFNKQPFNTSHPPPTDVKHDDDKKDREKDRRERDRKDRDRERDRSERDRRDGSGRDNRRDRERGGDRGRDRDRSERDERRGGERNERAGDRNERAGDRIDRGGDRNDRGGDRNDRGGDRNERGGDRTDRDRGSRDRRDRDRDRERETRFSSRDNNREERSREKSPRNQNQNPNQNQNHQNQDQNQSQPNEKSLQDRLWEMANGKPREDKPQEYQENMRQEESRGNPPPLMDRPPPRPLMEGSNDADKPNESNSGWTSLPPPRQGPPTMGPVFRAELRMRGPPRQPMRGPWEGPNQGPPGPFGPRFNGMGPPFGRPPFDGPPRFERPPFNRMSFDMNRPPFDGPRPPFDGPRSLFDGPRPPFGPDGPRPPFGPDGPMSFDGPRPPFGPGGPMPFDGPPFDGPPPFDVQPFDGDFDRPNFDGPLEFFDRNNRRFDDREQFDRGGWNGDRDWDRRNEWDDRRRDDRRDRSSRDDDRTRDRNDRRRNFDDRRSRDDRNSVTKDDKGRDNRSSNREDKNTPIDEKSSQKDDKIVKDDKAENKIDDQPKDSNEEQTEMSTSKEEKSERKKDRDRKSRWGAAEESAQMDADAQLSEMIAECSNDNDISEPSKEQIQQVQDLIAQFAQEAAKSHEAAKLVNDNVESKQTEQPTDVGSCESNEISFLSPAPSMNTCNYSKGARKSYETTQNDDERSFDNEEKSLAAPEKSLDIQAREIPEHTERTIEPEQAFQAAEVVESDANLGSLYDGDEAIDTSFSAPKPTEIETNIAIPETETQQCEAKDTAKADMFAVQGSDTPASTQAKPVDPIAAAKESAA